MRVQDKFTDDSQTVAERVVERVDEALKADVMHWATFYVRLYWVEQVLFLISAQESRMRIGSKKIFHLEAWAVKVMTLYKVESKSQHFCGEY
jgi:replication factor C subunit 3/5